MRCPWSEHNGFYFGSAGRRQRVQAWDDSGSFDNPRQPIPAMRWALEGAKEFLSHAGNYFMGISRYSEVTTCVKHPRRPAVHITGIVRQTS